MARVPIATNTVGLASPGVSARVEAPNMGAGGEMVGRALEGLGGQLDQSAQQYQEASQFHDQATVKEAVNNVLTGYTQSAYTGPDAYFTKDGRDAVAARPDLEKNIDTLIADQRKGLKDPRQQKMFDLAMTPQRLDWGVTIARHADEQQKTYEKDQTDGLISNTAELAKHQYINDPVGAETQISTGLQEVQRYWQGQGAAPEFIAAQQLKYSSGIYRDVGINLAYQNGQQGIDLAKALIDKHGGSMTQDDIDAVSAHVRAAQDTLNAQARQAEADQRRQVEQAQKDARLRAQSAAGLLDSGLPMDPKTYATAVSDAQTAQDVELLKKLQEGQLKNTTLFTHQHDTPVALQDQINALSADITKAGAKADPNKIIQRDALQQLYNNSSEQLRSNGVGWLAQHLGMAPQPLNIMDPSSIQARVQLVNQGRSATGQDIAPLQPAELPLLQQTWKGGNAENKTNMVMRLAQFGALAPDVAAQIAPGDNGLLHLIGLASHSNRGVGYSRVSQALAGYEAMKTEGQLVGKKASASDFSDFTGGALQFMPGARDGVFTVAKALMAEDAAQHGWSDTNPPDDKAWYRAVNSALGAYNRGNVQYGGLARFNGAQTVLPENMSLDDFEGRISRASGPQMRGAANGLPVAADGSPLNAGDLKKMHFVPIDDGRYRLENGGSFVHLADGRTPFEIDVRKLPNGAANPVPKSTDQYDRSTWAKRPDGSTKGTGFLGVLKRPDGGVSTEISVGLPINGKEMDVPTMVPGLTKSEINWLLKTPVDRVAKELPDSIRQKAIAHAKARIAAGKSPFKQDNEVTSFDQQLAAHGYTRF